MLNTIVEAIKTCSMFLSKIIFLLTLLIVSKVHGPKVKTIKLATVCLDILPNVELIRRMKQMVAIMINNSLKYSSRALLEFSFKYVHVVI